MTPTETANLRIILDEYHALLVNWRHEVLAKKPCPYGAVSYFDKRLAMAQELQYALKAQA